MQKKSSIFLTVAGVIILLAGLLTYGLGIHEILPVPRPNLVVAATSLIGTFLTVCGICDLFIKKSREMEIAEKDERNIALGNAAMASGFKVMSVFLAITICVLSFTGYITIIPFLAIFGAYAVGQIAFIARLYYLHKTM